MDAGLPDNAAVNDEIIRQLLDVGQQITEGNRKDFPIELTGSIGKVKVLSTWTILPDGRAYLSTIKVIPR